MIDTETLFILGSGSSKPYDFPTDAELQQRIISDFENDYNRLPYTFDLDSDNTKFDMGIRTYEAKDFIKGLKSTQGIATIDELISLNKRYEFIGKIAIQNYLLEYERNYSEKRDKDYISDWFELVLRKLLKECIEQRNPSFLELNNINFLTFNYDRLLEYLFINQFTNLFSELLNDNINKHQVDFFLYKIIHVYGALGYLPRRKDGSHTEVEFGEKITTYERIKETLQNIRLIKDGFKDYDRISKKLYYAKKIYFLGVGYIEKNMKMLELHHNLNFNDPPQIYGTALGKEKEINEIIKKYFTFNKEIPKPIIEAISCKDLIEKHI